jgi:hypothetical protein
MILKELRGYATFNAKQGIQGVVYALFIQVRAIFRQFKLTNRLDRNQMEQKTPFLSPL